MAAHVVVVGAGYAGVSAVKRLTRAGTRVTVVNPRDEFVERIRLHQLAAGTHRARRPLRELLPPGTELVLGTAERIAPDARTVLLRDGGTLRWDRLVYAVGSRSGTADLPGAGEHAATVGDLEGALDARARLAALPAGSAVTVVGGGLTGIETAAEIAGGGRFAVRLITGGGLGDGTGDRAPAHLRDALRRLGVDVVEHTKVTGVEAAAVATADGRTLPSALTIAAAGVELPALAADSGLAHDPDGALRVRADLVGVGGRPAAVVKEMVCRSTVGLGLNPRLPRVAWSW